MTATWLAAILCVGAMGFAIQRGGTCTVAAVEEVLTQRRAHRLLAMLEASVWVAGGLALAQWAHLERSMPAGYGANAWSILGGALLGFGAWVNRACVFGAVARLGSGEWVYLATPLGFFVGCWSVMSFFGRPPAMPLQEVSALFRVTGAFATVFLLYAAWRLLPGVSLVRSADRGTRLRQAIWSPHAATIVIGVSFVLAMLLAGRWAYTDVLADLARAMGGGDRMLTLPVMLLLALYAGALLGGITAGKWGATPVAVGLLPRCFAGGVLMAWGSLLIPGSNDGLILIGIPLLRPYAWLAFASMVVTIAAAILAQGAFASRRSQARA